MPWKLSTEYTFDSAHTIEGYDGPCGRVHGHTYRVRLELQSDKLRPSQYVKKAIMVADFKTLKWAKKDVSEGGLDHCYLNDLADLSDTTAEVIAAYIYAQTMQRVRQHLPAGDGGADLQLKVTVWETPESYCEYWE